MACVTDKKKKGRWAVDFYDQQGKRRLKVLPKGATKKQAIKLLREIEKQVDRRTYLPTKNVPTFQKVATDWLEFKKLNIRPSTWRKYEGYLRNHFQEIAHLKITRIHTARVERFITKRQSAGMNISTLRKLIVMFNGVMKYAVRHRLIDYNPVRDAERPKDQGGVEREVVTILSPEQIAGLIDAEPDTKYKTLFMLAVFSGARQGELFGLKWTDVDWFNNQIQIKRTFNEGEWYRPKSKTSKRQIDIGPTMMAVLREWHLACPPNDLDLVFPNEAGGPLDHGNLTNRHFYPALKRANLPHIRFHDIRHTYASLLIEQGENIKYIQSQLGHASPMVTLSVYAHLMKPVNQESALRLEKTILKKNGDQMETKTTQGATE